MYLCAVCNLVRLIPQPVDTLPFPPLPTSGFSQQSFTLTKIDLSQIKISFPSFWAIFSISTPFCFCQQNTSPHILFNDSLNSTIHNAPLSRYL